MEKLENLMEFFWKTLSSFQKASLTKLMGWGGGGGGGNKRVVAYKCEIGYKI